VQAQEYPVARWSLGLRAEGLSEAAVDEALADGTILRTHVLRDTWHLVAREDIRWIVELTRPRIRARNATIHRRLDLGPALLARAEAVILDALREHRALSRRQLAGALREHGIDAEGPRLAYVLMHAELALLVCSGPPAGKQHTYALVDERAGRSGSLEGDEALAELARRYFESHGPATPRDFAWWASLTAGEARRGAELLGAELVRTEAEGRTYWEAAAAPASAGPHPRAHLLQGYDEYVIAYSESRDVLDVQGLARVTPAGRAMYTHAIAVDGQIVGHWRRRLTAKAMTIDVQLARPLDRGERAALHEAVDRYGRFVGLPVRVETSS
jgi:Winged helix DNA-binding domain